jgi:hypothetical protein
MADIFTARTEGQAWSGTSTDPVLASRWRQQTQWRSLAAGVPLVAILIAAPFARLHNIDQQSPSVPHTAIQEFLPDEVDVESATATPKPVANKIPLDGSTPTSEVLAPATPPHARATKISNAPASKPRCSEILPNAKTGEPLSDEVRTYLQKECQ